MFTRSLFRRLASRTDRLQAVSLRGRLRKRPLRVEPLEQRQMLSVNPVVDSLVDEADGDHSPGNLSLREAILLTNADSGPDTITFDPALFGGGPGSINLALEQMTITDSVTITGPGQDTLTINAGGLSQIFRINDGDSSSQSVVTLSGMTLTNGQAPVAAIDGGAIYTTEDLTISGCTISNSHAGDGADSEYSTNRGGDGGAIYARVYADSSSTIMIQNSTITGNSSGDGGNNPDPNYDGGDSGCGGAIFAALGDSGDLLIENSVFKGNLVGRAGNGGSDGGHGGYGGAVYLNDGDMLVLDSSFSGNRAGDSGTSADGGGTPGGHGGAISVVGMLGGNGYGGDLTVENSIFANNSAGDGGDSTDSGNFGGRGGHGGAIHMDDSNNLTVSNSTLSGNSAGIAGTGPGGSDNEGCGGAINLDSDHSYFDLFHSTITNNHAGYRGGGIMMLGFGSTEDAQILHSIVAGNTSIEGPDIRGFDLTPQYSIVGDNSGTNLAAGAPDASGNWIGTAASPIDPLLGPLANNGGLTLTHALLDGSLAINNGQPGIVPPMDYDQRGAPFDRVADGRIDIGAFEKAIFDFGDAPDPTYPTLLASDGARHRLVVGFHLGTALDTEADGQPNAGATGDDNDGSDDEDGVVIHTSLRAGFNMDVDVEATGDGLLNAWIDFNADGDWLDAGEQIFADAPLSAGTNRLNFVVPDDVIGGDTFARFRFSTAGGLAPTGPADDGEVEDYQVTVYPVTDLGTVDFTEYVVDPLTGSEYYWFRFAAFRDGVVTAEVLGSAANITLHERTPGGLVQLAYDSGRVDYGMATAGTDYYVRIADLASAFTLRIANLVQVNPAGTQITVFDTAGDDVLEAWAGDRAGGIPHALEINGVRYESTTAVATQCFAGAGSDTAIFHDSPYDDTFNGNPDLVTLTTPDVVVTAEGFDIVQAYAKQGGFDVASFYDSLGNDVFVATPTYAKMTGAGFFLRAKFFDVAHGYASNGGDDTARFVDSAQNDTYVGTAKYGKMITPDVMVRAKFFDRCFVQGTGGGNDVARLYGTNGDETWVSSQASARLTSADYFHNVEGIETLLAHGGPTAGAVAGIDVAHLHDSGGDDTFTVEQNEGSMTGPGYAHTARFFAYVHGYAPGAGNDTAYLHGSDGDERLVCRPTYSRMIGTDFMLRAKLFDEVHADPGSDGVDEAWLYDTAGDNLLTGDATSVAMNLTGPPVGLMYQLAAFDTVHARSSQGIDTTDLPDPIPAWLDLLGNWQ